MDTVAPAAAQLLVIWGACSLLLTAWATYPRLEGGGQLPQ